jgi:hypothetical protein
MSDGSTSTELTYGFVPLKEDRRHILAKKVKQRFVAFERSLVCTIGFLLMIVATLYIFAMGYTHEPARNLWETFVNNALGFGTALFLFFAMLYLVIAVVLSLELFREGLKRARGP